MAKQAAGAGHQRSRPTMTTATPAIHRAAQAQPRMPAGRWRVDPIRSNASFTARIAGRAVRGRVPLTGGALISESIQGSPRVWSPDE
jgi:hypothetical protein